MEEGGWVRRGGVGDDVEGGRRGGGKGEGRGRWTKWGRYRGGGDEVEGGDEAV